MSFACSETCCTEEQVEIYFIYVCVEVRIIQYLRKRLILTKLCNTFTGCRYHIHMSSLTLWSTKSQSKSFFLIGIVGGGVQTGSTRHVGHWMAYCTCPGWLWWWRIWWNEDWQEKTKYSEKTCPSDVLSTTNPTWPDPGLKPGRRCGKPATNRLSYGAA
jgi:hypothetical protein